MAYVLWLPALSLKSVFPLGEIGINMLYFALSWIKSIKPNRKEKKYYGYINDIRWKVILGHTYSFDHNEVEVFRKQRLSSMSFTYAVFPIECEARFFISSTHIQELWESESPIIIMFMISSINILTWWLIGCYLEHSTPKVPVGNIVQGWLSWVEFVGLWGNGNIVPFCRI